MDLRPAWGRVGFCKTAVFNLRLDMSRRVLALPLRRLEDTGACLAYLAWLSLTVRGYCWPASSDISIGKARDLLSGNYPAYGGRSV